MNIDLHQVAALIKIAEQSNIDELEITQNQTNIRITCRHSAHAHSLPQHYHEVAAQNPSGLPQAVSTQSSYHYDSNHIITSPIDVTHKAVLTTEASQSNQADAVSTHTIVSPMVGTFYRRSSPDTPVFVEVGQTVAVGDTLCIVEAMKIMHEVKAEQAGVIQAILVNDGDMVEYAQTLFSLA